MHLKKAFGKYLIREALSNQHSRAFTGYVRKHAKKKASMHLPVLLALIRAEPK